MYVVMEEELNRRGKLVNDMVSAEVSATGILGKHLVL